MVLVNYCTSSSSRAYVFICFHGHFMWIFANVHYCFFNVKLESIHSTWYNTFKLGGRRAVWPLLGLGLLLILACRPVAFFKDVKASGSPAFCAHTFYTTLSLETSWKRQRKGELVSKTMQNASDGWDQKPWVRNGLSRLSPFPACAKILLKLLLQRFGPWKPCVISELIWQRTFSGENDKNGAVSNFQGKEIIVKIKKQTKCHRGQESRQQSLQPRQSQPRALAEHPNSARR